MTESHPCRLVPRALYPRWDRPERAKELLAFCRKIGAEELMVFPTAQFLHPGWLTREQIAARAEQLAALRQEAARGGIEVLLNDCVFIDDLGLCAGIPDAPQMPWAVDITGKTAVGYRCFLAPAVRKAAAERLVRFAASGVRKIFVDDEVRHDWHPSQVRNEGAHYCFCDLHLAGFGKFIKRKITRPQLVKALQSNRPADMALRVRWLEFKRRVLLEFITHCAKAVHKDHPTTRVGQMTTFFHFASLGGLPFGQQVSAWADGLRPLCRPGQGWYCDHDRTGLILGVAQTLWCIACLDPGAADTELYSEVDWGAPWTQFKHSCRMFADFQIKNNLLLNIKTHSIMTSMGEGPEDPFMMRRTSAAIARERKLMDALAAELPEKARRIGLQFVMTEKLAAAYPLRIRGPEGDAADPWGVTGAGLGLPPWGQAFGVLARSGIALTFDDSPVAVLTGGLAPALGREATARLLHSRNMVIDGTAAMDLQEMGLLETYGVKIPPPIGTPINEKPAVDSLHDHSPGDVLAISQCVSTAKVRHYQLAPRGGIKQRVLSHIVDPAGRKAYGAGLVMVDHLPGGRRACLLPFDLSDENLWGFALRRRQWHGMLDFLAAGGGPWAVWIDDAFEVWPVTYRLRGDPRMWVGLINYGHDPVDDATLWLAASPRAKVRYIDDQGVARTVPESAMRREAGRLGVALRTGHAVRGLDVRLLIVEP